MRLEFKVRKPLNVVFEYLTDMQRFAAVHPVITHIDSVGANSYLVHEVLRFAFIPWSFTYPVTIQQNSNTNSIEYRATVMKMVRIEIVFHLNQTNDTTTVTEEIQFRSWLPVSFIMQKIFRKQHTKLFSNMDAA